MQLRFKEEVKCVIITVVGSFCIFVGVVVVVVSNKICSPFLLHAISKSYIHHVLSKLKYVSETLI